VSFPKNIVRKRPKIFCTSLKTLQLAKKPRFSPNFGHTALLLDVIGHRQVHVRVVYERVGDQVGDGGHFG